MPPSPPARSRSAQQLRPGRHGLSREAVADNQRTRILDAVSDVVSAKGYVAMSVEDVIAAAGVSRRTFYDHFRGKEAAYLEAYEAVGAELIRRVGTAYSESRSLAEGIVACLRAFLHFSAEQPAYAHMCLVEVLAAGPAAIERRNDVMRALAEVLHRGTHEDPVSARPPLVTAEWVVGGVYEVVYARLVGGDASDLPALLPDLAYSIMLTYLGEELARVRTEALTGVAPPAV